MLGDRFNRSWQVTKDSWQVLRANPALALFPVISGLGTLIVSVPFLIALAAISMGDRGHGIQHHTFSTLHYALSGAMYFCTYFVVIFFNSALVACAHESLQGRPTSIGSGIDAAIKRLPQILGWTLVASTVGIILRTIGQQTGIVGRIATAIIGIAWNIAVFFVVPCLVIDQENPFAALKSSTAMLKQTWGERIILGVGVGYAIGMLALLALIPLVAGIFLMSNNMVALGLLLLVMAVLYWIVVAVAGSAVTTIYQTALYLYSRHDTVPVGFNAEYMRSAFAPRPERKFFGR